MSNKSGKSYSQDGDVSQVTHRYKSMPVPKGILLIIPIDLDIKEWTMNHPSISVITIPDGIILLVRPHEEAPHNNDQIFKVVHVPNEPVFLVQEKDWDCSVEELVEKKISVQVPTTSGPVMLIPVAENFFQRLKQQFSAKANENQNTSVSHKNTTHTEPATLSCNKKD